MPNKSPSSSPTIAYDDYTIFCEENNFEPLPWTEYWKHMLALSQKALTMSPHAWFRNPETHDE